MIKVLLFAALYLSDFSSVNSLQFTGRGFCAATDGGVFVYDNNRGIVASYASDGVRLASYDNRSGEIAFITKDGILYVYSPFFESVRKVGLTRGVVGMGFSSGIIMLLYSNGARKYVSKFNQPAPSIYIDTMFQTKPRVFPLYLKTRTYENACHIFKDPIAYAPGYNMDFVGTKGNGVYLFDRRMKKLKNTIYINIKPPIKKLTIIFDTLYVLHSAGITKISTNYMRSLSEDCFQYGFLPVDFVYAGGEVFLLNRNGFYTIDDPYFFNPINESCHEAVGSFSTGNNSFITTRNCLLSVSDRGETLVEYKTEGLIEDAGSDGESIYLIIEGRLYTLKDTVVEEVLYAREPISTHRVVLGYGALYVPARRGLFVISGGEVKLVKTPFNLLLTVSGVFADNVLYLALPDKVVVYDFMRKNWKTYNLGQEKVSRITALTEFEGKLYIGYEKGVLVE